MNWQALSGNTSYTNWMVKPPNRRSTASFLLTGSRRCLSLDFESPLLGVLTENANKSNHGQKGGESKLPRLTSA